MTAITVERELLEQALIALTYQGTMGPTRRQRRAATVAALRVALAAQATAPAQPAGHDAPTCPESWINWHNHVHQIKADNPRKFSLNSDLHWFNPIPEDKP